MNDDTMTDSQKFLGEYVKDGSESAFRELVARYIDLVYSSAVRLVDGDRHLAEDVAQEVFADLARLAHGLSAEVLLGGWLHRHTCFVATKTMRRERRRQNRERKAVELNAIEDHAENRFEDLVPILDEAVNQLSGPDRAAIVLRFFEGRDLRSVGQSLKTNEDAARKRVARALERLRRKLACRGVELSGAGLATLLAAEAVTAAPVGLDASAASAALAGAVVADSSATSTLLNLMALTKLKLAVGAVVVVGLGTALMVKFESQALRRAEQVVPSDKQSRTLTSSIPEAAEMRLSTPLPTASHPPRPRLPAPRVKTQSGEPETTELGARLIHGEEFKLSRVQVESYLEKQGRGAEKLVASWIASSDMSLLGEALEKYPNDPLVNLVNYGATLLEGLPPEEHRQRLDGFKQSAPDNPLASYLSAFEHFNTGQTDQAVQDLQEAYAKGSIEDYRTVLFQDLETMYREAGYSAADASAIASATPIPYLSRLSLLGRQISDLADLYRQGGDESSAQASLQIGVDLGDRLTRLSDYPIANLAGIRMQMRLLQGLDGASSVGPNGLTVSDQLASLSRQEQNLVELGQRTLSPEDRANGRLWFGPKLVVQGPK